MASLHSSHTLGLPSGTGWRVQSPSQGALGWQFEGPRAGSSLSSLLSQSEPWETLLRSCGPLPLTSVVSQWPLLSGLKGAESCVPGGPLLVPCLSAPRGTVPSSSLRICPLLPGSPEAATQAGAGCLSWMGHTSVDFSHGLSLGMRVCP